MPCRRPPPVATRMQIGVMNSHRGGAWACLKRRAVGAAGWVEPACGVNPGRCGRSEFRADLHVAFVAREVMFADFRFCGRGAELSTPFFQKRRSQSRVLGPGNRAVERSKILYNLPNSHAAIAKLDATFKVNY